MGSGMETISQYIDMGWHTVPLRGKIKRLEDGTKTIPSFESGWREKWQEKFNNNATKLGGVITGKCSNLIAIDCDNPDTYAMFKALNPGYAVEFKSKGKGKLVDGEFKPYDCGTILYAYDNEMPYTFSINNNSLALDVYANNGFIYLATEANETKEPAETLQIEPMPATVKLLLKQLHTLKSAPPEEAKDENLKNISSGNCLAPLVEQFTKNKEFMPGLFKIITPKNFRSEPQYVQKGYLHPENIPQGRGSEYLSKVSAILGADISISLDLYISAMHEINELWDSPMEADKLDATICDPMINGNASVNGRVIWKYDENWKKFRLVLHTKRQANMELGFDDNRNMYYAVDVVNENTKAFGRDAELQSYIEATAINAPKKAEVKRALPIINVASDPTLPFGFNLTERDSERTLNLFKQTPELSIIKDPASYSQFYKRPKFTLMFLESLVPDPEMRDYLLKFTKYKLTYFKYSPVILYFLGAHGSGKDTYVQILEQIMGNIARPTTKEFLELFNGWLLDSYFVQLDEYGNQLNRMQDKEEALGKLKSYTGKQKVQIRQMRTDGFDYKHSATFIMTANKNPLMFEDGDRRIAFMPTPNKLNEQDWVTKSGGVSTVHDKIMSEIKDFCYFLATEVDTLPSQDYVTPPSSEAKLSLIADSMYPAARIAYAMQHEMIDYLHDLATDAGAQKTAQAIKNNKLLETDLEHLYDALTDMNGDLKALNKAIRLANVKTYRTQDGVLGYDVFPSSPFEERD